MLARLIATNSMIATASRPRFTLDSDILVYSVDSAAGARHELAIQIALHAVRADCWLTLQALGEFYSVATRKNKMPRHEAAAQVNDWLSSYPTVAASAANVRAALSLASAGRASYWDALLIVTAADAGCGLVLTEDLADGAIFGSTTIHNPFTSFGGLTERTQDLLNL